MMIGYTHGGGEVVWFQHDCMGDSVRFVLILTTPFAIPLIYTSNDTLRFQYHTGHVQYTKHDRYSFKSRR